MATIYTQDNASAVNATLNASEAAKHLQINANTLANWRCSGRGPKYYKVGSRVVYRRDDLDAYLDGRCRESWAEVA